MESDFGILPMPKLDEEQDNYYTAMNPVAFALNPKLAAANKNIGGIDLLS
jgi:hypothetical protein